MNKSKRLRLSLLGHPLRDNELDFPERRQLADELFKRVQPLGVAERDPTSASMTLTTTDGVKYHIYTTKDSIQIIDTTKTSFGPRTKKGINMTTWGKRIPIARPHHLGKLGEFEVIMRKIIAEAPSFAKEFS
jgi:hypothetical protein